MVSKGFHEKKRVNIFIQRVKQIFHITDTYVANTIFPIDARLKTYNCHNYIDNITVVKSSARLHGFKLHLY